MTDTTSTETSSMQESDIPVIETGDPSEEDMGVTILSTEPLPGDTEPTDTPKEEETKNPGPQPPRVTYGVIVITMKTGASDEKNCPNYTGEELVGVYVESVAGYTSPLEAAYDAANSIAMYSQPDKISVPRTIYVRVEKPNSATRGHAFACGQAEVDSYLFTEILNTIFEMEKEIVKDGEASFIAGQAMMAANQILLRMNAGLNLGKTLNGLERLVAEGVNKIAYLLHGIKELKEYEAIGAEEVFVKGKRAADKEAQVKEQSKQAMGGSDIAMDLYTGENDSSIYEFNPNPY